MAFMVPEYLERRAWHVDGPEGVRPFFASLGATVDALEGDPLDVWLEEEAPAVFADILGDEVANVWSVERDDGPRWYARLSAPGYMDATEWSGPHDTKADAMADLQREHDVDPETGEPLTDD